MPMFLGQSYAVSGTHRAQCTRLREIKWIHLRFVLKRRLIAIDSGGARRLGHRGRRCALPPFLAAGVAAVYGGTAAVYGCIHAVYGGNDAIFGCIAAVFAGSAAIFGGSACCCLWVQCCCARAHRQRAS
eukprot:209258-Rhodomonas_salina.2